MKRTLQTLTFGVDAGSSALADAGYRRYHAPHTPFDLEEALEPETKLDALKSRRFPPEGKETRVIAALEALRHSRFPFRLPPEDAAWAFEDADVEEV